MTDFYGHGKLMLTGEYLVLDGGESIAFPSRKGQYLKVKENHSGILSWKALDEQNRVWLAVEFDLPKLRLVSATYDTPDEQTDVDYPERLLDLLHVCKQLNPEFLSEIKGLEVQTKLEFNRHWGLGSSSTLIYTLSQWAKVDTFELLEKTFGGSGYDVACAGASKAILFKWFDKKPVWNEIDLNFGFKKDLFFVYLNEKMNSRKGIRTYRSNTKEKNLTPYLKRLSLINQQIIASTNLVDFEDAVLSHERMISELIEQPSVKDRLFKDYTGVVKSLGAWGGDFCLATGGEQERAYFRKKGYHSIIEFDQMLFS